MILDGYREKKKWNDSASIIGHHLDASGCLSLQDNICSVFLTWKVLKAVKFDMICWWSHANDELQPEDRLTGTRARQTAGGGESRCSKSANTWLKEKAGECWLTKRSPVGSLVSLALEEYTCTGGSASLYKMIVRSREERYIFRMWQVRWWKANTVWWIHWTMTR